MQYVERVEQSGMGIGHERRPGEVEGIPERDFTPAECTPREYLSREEREGSVRSGVIVEYDFPVCKGGPGRITVKIGDGEGFSQVDRLPEDIKLSESQEQVRRESASEFPAAAASFLHLEFLL